MSGTTTGPRIGTAEHATRMHELRDVLGVPQPFEIPDMIPNPDLDEMSADPEADWNATGEAEHLPQLTTHAALEWLTRFRFSRVDWHDGRWRVWVWVESGRSGRGLVARGATVAECVTAIRRRLA